MIQKVARISLLLSSVVFTSAVAVGGVGRAKAVSGQVISPGPKAIAKRCCKKQRGVLLQHNLSEDDQALLLRLKKKSEKKQGAQVDPPKDVKLILAQAALKLQQIKDSIK